MVRLRPCAVCAFLFLIIAVSSVAHGQQSVARRWDEAILDAIRVDTPRPPIHARNLYHMSAAMYDAWAAYDSTAQGLFVTEKHNVGNVEAARNEAISYAAYRVLSDRYTLSVNAAASLAEFDALMGELGYDVNNTSTVGDTPAAIGNRIAQQILNTSLNDGSNEANNYADTTGYASVNTPMIVNYATATDQAHTPLQDPNRWQPLYINQFTSQNGQVQPSNLQKYVAPQWAPVTPFAMQSTSGPYSWSDLDPGPQPKLNGVGHEQYRQEALDVLRKSNSLDPTKGVGAELIDISPASNGNRPLGTHNNQGYSVNPATGLAYTPEMVKKADYYRVLAEFWADGPHSETPPGHWNVLANQVSDNPMLTKRIAGIGPVVNNLEWDVKMYMALNGAVHDAAIGAWGAKRVYDGARPITMIRYMGGLGQSSDPLKPSYNANGLPLEDGFIELVTAESIADGGRHRFAFLNANKDHNGDFFPFFSEEDLVGKVVVHAWGQEPNDPANETRGTDWVLAERWQPYQMDTFVTPAFPGYISGHSTFSRSAAEIMSLFTGSEYFPGGIGSQVINTDFLKFEDGPTQPITLEWAKYFDAADEAGISRLLGGIHVAADDFGGRIMGDKIGKTAFAKALEMYLASNALPGDSNFDDKVDLLDFASLRSHFNASYANRLQGDFNSDRKVNLLDFAILRANFNRVGATVPEPALAGVLAGVAMVVLARRARNAS